MHAGAHTHTHAHTRAHAGKCTREPVCVTHTHTHMQDARAYANVFAHTHMHGVYTQHFVQTKVQIQRTQMQGRARSHANERMHLYGVPPRALVCVCSP